MPRAHVDEPCECDDYFADEDRWEQRNCEAWDETLDGRTYRVFYDGSGGVHSTRPVTVPVGSYFVLGDNRDNSHDSRYWGLRAAREHQGRGAQDLVVPGPRRRALGANRPAGAVVAARTSAL